MLRNIFAFFLVLGLQSISFAQENPALDDLLTPAELLVEMGLAPAESLDANFQNLAAPTPMMQPFTPEEAKKAYGVNIYAEFPLVIVVSKASQSAVVYHNGQKVNEFLISTGRERWEIAKSGRKYFSSTPAGWYSPQTYVRDHYSKTWKARMEFSIFFIGGIALHATTEDHYKELGTKASGGCVRMKYEIANWFWDLSKSIGTVKVPAFNSTGQILRNLNGTIQRQQASGTLIIVTDN